MGLPLRWFIACLLFTLAAGVMAFNKDDGVLVDETQESGGNNLYCGWMSGRSRLFDKPIALVEQSVVAANYA